jgi:hypothetical protein
VFHPIGYAVRSAAISYAPKEAKSLRWRRAGNHGWVVELHYKDQCQAGGAAMKQLEVGDRVKILDGGKDDEGTVLDVDERTEMVIVYLGRHVGGRAFHRDDLRKVRAH